jgi:hypothetical protein
MPLIFWFGLCFTGLIFIVSLKDNANSLPTSDSKCV